MKNTDLNSNVFCRSKEGYGEYCIKLSNWAEFFNGHETFCLLIADDSENFIEDNYRKTYEYLENEQEEVLMILEKYCLKEYNNRRAVCINNCRKRYLEDMIKLYPEILDRESAVRFFQLLKVQILPFKKEGE